MRGRLGGKQHSGDGAASRRRITDRDEHIIDWVNRHGLVTREHIAKRFFLREKGMLAALRQADRRVAALVRMGLLERNPWKHRAPYLVRVTKTGAQYAGNGIGPAPVPEVGIKHTLQVVSLLIDLELEYPNAVFTTERELRAHRPRARAVDETSIGQYRFPDALMRLDGKNLGIELDRSWKSKLEYKKAILALVSEGIDHVWWYCTEARSITTIASVCFDEGIPDFVSARKIGPLS